MSASVLIVEDERLVAWELGIRLEESGYRVTARVGAADDALRAATEQVPDVVLMDIRLEGERDGIEAAELLQQRFDVPVVFLTAHSDDETVARAKQVGSGYLLKPPKERELLVAIEVALHRHAMSRQLRERERLLASTLRSVGEALVATDPAGNIAFMNPIAESLTGWRAEDALGLPLSTVVNLTHDRDRGAPRFAQPSQQTATIIDRDGRSRAVSDSASPIIGETGAVLGGVVLLRDVTEERMLERQREAAARLASLGTLAAGVAHQVNNPLTWMIVNLNHLSASLTASVTEDQLVVLRDEAAESLDGAERIQRIVRDLSAFAHRTPDRDRCFVADAIRQAIAAAASEIPIVVDPIDACVSIEESRLVRVLGNLLANAADAIADAPARDHRITIHATRRPNAIVLEIVDTGIGMDDATRALAFEPFFTTKPFGRGTGLGLSVAHGLIAAAGGSIQLASTPGQHTTVTVVLPLADEPPLEHGTQEVARILVVDDEAVVRKLMTRLLREYDVTAVGPLEARQLIHDGARFDLIFCDLMMPELDGVQLSQEIRAVDPEQAGRIVFLTGGAVSERTTAFLATTNTPILEKPFRPADLLAFAESAKRTP